MIASKDFQEKVGKNINILKDLYFFGLVLEGFAVFFICAIVLVLTGLKFYYALVPTILFVLLRHFLTKADYDKINKVEEGNPALEEKLRTAYDNAGEDNPIVRGLVREVTNDLESVRTDKFLNSKKIGGYIVLNIFCVFILLFLLLSGFELFKFNELAGGATNSDSSGSGGGGKGSGSGSSSSEMGEPSETSGAGKGGTLDIFGEKSIASLDGEKLELQIEPGYGEGESFDDHNTDIDEKVREVSGESASATAAGTYNDEIPVEMEEIVRKYFERLAEDS